MELYEVSSELAQVEARDVVCDGALARKGHQCVPTDAASIAAHDGERVDETCTTIDIVLPVYFVVPWAHFSSSSCTILYPPFHISFHSLFMTATL